MLVILLNCVTLGMFQPCEDVTCQSEWCRILQVSAALWACYRMLNWLTFTPDIHSVCRVIIDYLTDITTKSSYLFLFLLLINHLNQHFNNYACANTTHRHMLIKKVMHVFSLFHSRIFLYAFTLMQC